jgi:hypothetical protein
LILALESEVAGLYCAALNFDDFVGNTLPAKEDLPAESYGEGTEYLVLDCGG